MIAEERRPPDCQSRANGRARAALVWGVLAFLAGQGVLAYVAGRSNPEIRDPEYGYRLVRLREQAEAAPDRPLFLILGSSRTLSGICPPSLPAWPAGAGVEPRVFNFSVLGSGPVRELLTLRRLLAAGHRPQWLLIEVWPPYWPQQGYWFDEGHIMLQDLRPEDLHVVRRYFTNRRDAVEKLAFETLLPITGLRSNILARCAASLLSPDQRWREGVSLSGRAASRAAGVRGYSAARRKNSARLFPALNSKPSPAWTTFASAKRPMPPCARRWKSANVNTSRRP